MRTQLIIIIASLLAMQHVLALRPSPRSEEASASSSQAANSSIENQPSQNEIENDDEHRLVIGEPYKSLIQTTARFALAQTQVTQHVNIDTAMNLLNQIAYSLAKPIILFKAIKSLVVILATLMTTIFFFPGANQYMEAVWRDPKNALNLGFEERSVLAAIGSSTEETLSRVGLHDYSCRERSLCYIGEILKCSFPNSSEKLTKFVTENLTSSAAKENVYARAFASGFVDRNCTSVGLTDANGTKSCLGDFFSSLFNGSSSRTSGRSSSSSSSSTEKSRK